MISGVHAKSTSASTAQPASSLQWDAPTTKGTVIRYGGSALVGLGAAAGAMRLGMPYATSGRAQNAVLAGATLLGLGIGAALTQFHRAQPVGETPTPLPSIADILPAAGVRGARTDATVAQAREATQDGTPSATGYPITLTKKIGSTDGYGTREDAITAAQTGIPVAVVKEGARFQTYRIAERDRLFELLGTPNVVINDADTDIVALIANGTRVFEAIDGNGTLRMTAKGTPQRNAKDPLDLEKFNRTIATAIYSWAGDEGIRNGVTVGAIRGYSSAEQALAVMRDMPGDHGVVHDAESGRFFVQSLFVRGTAGATSNELIADYLASSGRFEFDENWANEAETKNRAEDKENDTNTGKDANLVAPIKVGTELPNTGTNVTLTKSSELVGIGRAQGGADFIAIEVGGTVLAPGGDLWIPVSIPGSESRGSGSR